MNIGSNGIYHSGALVAECHVGTLVVLICTAETGGGYFYEDLVALEVRPGGFGLDDLLVLGALVDGKGRHYGIVLGFVVWY
jgi:hypothetical protein